MKEKFWDFGDYEVHKSGDFYNLYKNGKLEPPKNYDELGILDCL